MIDTHLLYSSDANWKHLRTITEFVSSYRNNPTIFTIKTKLANQICDLILSEPKFFNIRTEDNYTKIEVNVIVFTEEEFIAECKKQFKAGLEHARNFLL